MNALLTFPESHSRRMAISALSVEIAPPTARAHRVLKLIAKAIVWIQVGPVTVRNGERLETSPALIVANHSHYVDFPIFLSTLQNLPRCMAARGVFTFAGGILGGLARAAGVIGVDLEPGKG